MFCRTPKVTQVPLQREYPFMYENFLIATQSEAYLILDKSGDVTYAIRFESADCKYGAPNDEALGGHPLAKYGLGSYRLFEVSDSPWIHDLMVANRVHPSHKDEMFADRKHYIATFKDVTVEVVCRSMSEVALSAADFAAIVTKQLLLLEDQS